MYVFDSEKEVWGELDRGLGLGFINPVGTGGMWDGYLCLGCGDVGVVCGEWVDDLVQALGG